MEASSFWLISIEESQVVVSLLSWGNGRHSVTSIGPVKAWSLLSEESFNIAVDESLSAAASDAGLNEEEEPVNSAFVLPPFWVGSDGKIVANKLKIIEGLCKSLSIRPIGFIANDEAIVEESNQSDGFPSSFILAHLGEQEFTLSLIYLGHIKERIKKSYEGEFDAKYIEAALLELKNDSTLPPQIIIFGKVSKDELLNIKNYAWVGKKDIETFLHFPEVKFYQVEDIITIFSKTILSQISPPSQTVNDEPLKKAPSLDFEAVEIEEDTPPEISEPIEPETDNAASVEDESEINQDEINDSVNIVPEMNLTQVAPEELGFVASEINKQNENEALPVIKQEDLVNFNVVNEILPVAPQVDPKPPLKLPKFNLPFGFLKKIKLSKKTGVKKSWIGLILLAVSPALILIPFFFSKAKLTLFVTPYTFDKQINVTLDPSANSINTSKAVIPVIKKTIDLKAEASTKTTGQKTIGEKSKGEIIIFNLQAKSQNLSAGTKLTDPSGKSFELNNAVTVAAGNFDLTAGVLKPGQTKASISASDIGPEYNINKDTKLQFKDFSESTLVAKVNDNLFGGTKETISAVGEQDKKDVEAKINQNITDSLSREIDGNLSKTSGIIRESIQNSKNKIEYSREVGEAADELIATADATVTVFILNDEIRKNIINEFLAKEPDYNDADINPETFTLEFKINELDNDQAKAKMTIKGMAIPKIDVLALKKSLSGKSKNKASGIIKKTIKRAYNFNFKTNFDLIKAINPLPFRSQNITIDIQTETL